MITAAVLWMGIRRPEALVAMLPSLAGLGALLTACLYVLLDNISRARWESRRGVACCRCGYEMRDPVSPQCPECGLIDARTHPYIPLWERLTRTQFVVLFVLVFGSFAIAIIGLALKGQT